MRLTAMLTFPRISSGILLASFNTWSREPPSCRTISSQEPAGSEGSLHGRKCQARAKHHPPGKGRDSFIHGLRGCGRVHSRR